MAENIINIATLAIDKEGAAQTIEETKKGIFDLQKANTELRKEINKNGDATGELTKKFVENDTELKKLNATYREQQTALNSLTLEEVKNTKAITDNAKSVGEAQAQNKELIKVRNQVDASTKDGAEAIELLNKKIDQNNKFVNQNTSLIEQQKNNVGNYADQFTEATSAVNIFSAQGLAGFKDKAEEAGGAGNLMKNSLGGVAQGFLGMAKSALAFIATPVGLVLTALVVVFLSIKEAMARSEEATKKVTKVFAALKGIASVLLKAFAALGEYFIDEYIKVIENVAKTTDEAVQLVSKGLKALGFDEAAKAVDDYAESTKNAVDASLQLAAAEATLEKEQRKARLTQLEFQKQAEKLRQARDDESKTIPQRIEANKQLGGVLKEQLAAELKIAQLALTVANARIEQDGKTKATLDAQADALTEIADIQERITGQESEQLQNRISLQKEAAEKAKEATERRAREAELEISIQRAKNAQLNQTDEERLKFINDITKKELELLKSKKASGLITEKEFLLESLELRKTQSEEVLDIAAATIDKEIEAQQKAFEAKKDISFNELIELKQNAAFLKDEQLKNIEESLLLESEKAIAKQEIERGYLESITILNDNYREAEKTRRDIALAEEQTLRTVAQELRVLDLEERNALEAEIQRVQLDQLHENTLLALDQELAAKSKTAAEVRALKELEDRKYAAATKKIDKEVLASKRNAQLGMVKDALTAASALFENNKAVAVAAALVNTYEGISAGVKLGYPAAIPAVASAAATGFLAVKNILKTKKGDTGGGASGANLSTPTSTFENPARTTTVATVNNAPPVEVGPSSQPVLVLETLEEVRNNQQIKITSG